MHELNSRPRLGKLLSPLPSSLQPCPAPAFYQKSQHGPHQTIHWGVVPLMTTRSYPLCLIYHGLPRSLLTGQSRPSAWHASASVMLPLLPPIKKLLSLRVRFVHVACVAMARAGRERAGPWLLHVAYRAMVRTSLKLAKLPDVLHLTGRHAACQTQSPLERGGKLCPLLLHPAWLRTVHGHACAHASVRGPWKHFQVMGGETCACAVRLHMHL